VISAARGRRECPRRPDNRGTVGGSGIAAAEQEAVSGYYYPGGKDNFAADREAAEKVLAVEPGAVNTAPSATAASA
jgi:S-adenosyl methyltransferase